MTQEIERSAKVFSSIQRNMEQDTGVMTSLNEEDVKNYLEKVKRDSQYSAKGRVWEIFNNKSNDLSTRTFSSETHNRFVMNQNLLCSKKDQPYCN